jgi:hypothetical protein
VHPQSDVFPGAHESSLRCRRWFPRLDLSVAWLLLSGARPPAEPLHCLMLGWALCANIAANLRGTTNMTCIGKNGRSTGILFKCAFRTGIGQRVVVAARCK